MTVKYRDHRADPAAWAKELGVSREAIDVYLSSDVIDLHVETFVPARLVGYDILKRHGRGPFGARLFGQVDLPRVREARITGATWSISTNPLRTKSGRAKTFLKNLQRIQDVFARAPGEAAICRNIVEYEAAKRADKHAVFLGIQGGNALDEEGALDLIPDDLIIRVTLVHLSTSTLGVTSAPGWGKKREGLSDAGREYVRALNAKKIFVDLAHIDRGGFFRAVEAHDKSQPLIVTHTGIDAVHPHWRNLTDEQIKAIAETGGTIGIIYQWPFLGPRPEAKRIVDHMAHVVDLVGDDHVSLGSDWDGMILPPRDMQTCLELPKLVQLMLDRGWSGERARKILGGNFLRVLGHLRGTTATTTTRAA